MDCKYDLHIIVPVFNGEKYIIQCLDSILNLREYGCDFFVTVVNDGSYDSTQDLLKSYEQYKFVEVIHQKNCGLSAARNRGLKVIKGKYILFVDADDTINADTINNLLIYSLKNNIDISLGTYALTDEDSKVISYSNDLKKFGRFLLSNQSINGYPWGKLIKAEFFRNLIFPVGFWFEDTIMSVILYKLAVSCFAINSVGYFYRQHGESIMSKCKHDLRAIDDWYVLNLCLNDRKLFGIANDDYVNILSNCFCSCKRVKALFEDIKKNLFICVCGFYKEYLSEIDVEKHVIKKIGGGYS